MPDPYQLIWAVSAFIVVLALATTPKTAETGPLSPATVIIVWAVMALMPVINTVCAGIAVYNAIFGRAPRDKK